MCHVFTWYGIGMLFTLLKHKLVLSVGKEYRDT